MGGGPAGLYAALLFRKALPRARVEVYERNRPDDTFGWGVVFSDRTMENFRAADAPSHEAITGSFHHWDDIDVHYRGTTTTTGGHGFCGIERKRLLGLLQERGRELGVVHHFQQEVEDDAAFADADLVVAADGVNSRTRKRHEADLRTRHRHARVPLHLARHDEALSRLHLRVRGDGARLVPGPRLPVQQDALDGHRRDARGDLARARPRPGQPRAVDRVLPKAVREVPRWPQAHEQRRAPARLGLAQLPARAVQALAPRQPRADRRCRPHRALLHRLGHQARDGGRHRARRAHGRQQPTSRPRSRPTRTSARPRRSSCRARRATACAGSRAWRATRRWNPGSSPTAC